METNHDGETDRPCSGHAAACPAGVSPTSDVRVRTNIGRNSDRPVTIDLAVPTILVTIARPATRGLRAAFNTVGVPDVPVTTDPPEVIGIPAAPTAPVTIGLRVPTLLEAVVGPPTVQTGVVAIGHKVVHGLNATAMRQLGKPNVGAVDADEDILCVELGPSLQGRLPNGDRRQCGIMRAVSAANMEVP